MELGVCVRPDDLARVIDAKCLGARDAQGVIEGGEAAAAKDKSVEVSAPTGRPRERPNDLTRAVDAFCLGVEVVWGIVDGGEDIDWHVVTLLSDAVSSAHRLAIPRWSGYPRQPQTLTKASIRVKKRILDDLDAFRGQL